MSCWCVVCGGVSSSSCLMSVRLKRRCSVEIHPDNDKMGIIRTQESATFAANYVITRHGSPQFLQLYLPRDIQINRSEIIPVIWGGYRLEVFRLKWTELAGRAKVFFSISLLHIFPMRVKC